MCSHYAKMLGAGVGARPLQTKVSVMNNDKRGLRDGETASEMIDARIRGLADWRGDTLARVRSLIRQADPDVIEEWKWGVPVWSHAGIVCTGEAYQRAVKLTFPSGASLDDPAGLFNASLDGKVRRAIDLHLGDRIDEGAFTALVRAAVARNTAASAERPARARKSA